MPLGGFSQLACVDGSVDDSSDAFYGLNWIPSFELLAIRILGDKFLGRVTQRQCYFLVIAAHFPLLWRSMN